MKDSTPNSGQDRPDISNAVLFALLKIVAVLLALLLLWRLQIVALLVFGAMLVALLLHSAAQFLSDKIGFGLRTGLAVAIIIIIAALGGFVVLLGNQVTTEIADVAASLPATISRFENWFGIQSLETWLTERLQESMERGSVVSGLSGASMIVANSAVGLGLVLAGGVFLAANPGLYHRGFLALLPSAHRETASRSLTEVAAALRLWLTGQLVAMLCVGVLTTIGLLLLGIPTAIGLGFLAGLLEFVPFVGPVASSLPAIAVGLSDGPLTALWVALLYVGVQQVEGIVLIPLIQRATVKLAPTVTLFAVISFGTLFGPVGVIFAAPLTVLVLTLVRELWVKPNA